MKYPGMLWVALVVVGAAFVFVVVLSLVTRLRRAASKRVETASVPISPYPEPSDRYSALLAMVLGDRDKAERLIAYEATKMRPRLIELAIQRLREDLAGRGR